MAKRAITDADQLPVLCAPRFVGRSRELAALGEVLAGAPAVVLIEGEAGVGKSRLLREFLGSPAGRGHRTLVGTCPPMRVAYTLGPVVDAVRDGTDQIRGLRLSRLAGALRPMFPEWADDLPPAPDQLPDSSAARHRLFRAFVELIDRLRATLLVLEDVHWADETTLEFLLFLASRRPQPLSVVVTYRPEEVRADSLLRRLSSRLPTDARSLRLALGTLGVDEIVEFVSSMLAGDQISAGFAEFLHRCTDGLPLALEESIRLMHDRADLIRRGDGWVRRHLDNLDVPPTIRDAVLERAARLGADAQAVLRAAAVLTDPVDQAVLADVAELPAERFAAGLAEALGCGLLGEDSRGLLSFRHGLVCQVVYEAVPAPERRRRHQLAGEALAGLTPVPVVALVRHFPGCGQTEAWCRYAEQAADLCRQAGDEATAGTLLHDVITGVRLPVDVLIRLVRRIQYTSFSHPDRFIELIQVLESVLDTRELTRGEQAALRYQIGRLYMVTGAYAAGQAQMKQVVPVLPTGSAEAIRARIFLGVPLGAVRPVAEHLRWLREMPEIPPSIPPDERLRLTADRIFALLLLGEEPAWTQAWQLPQRAGTPEEASALAAAYRNLGHMAMPGTYLPGAEWTPDRWISVCPVCRQGDKLYVYLAGGIPANDREKWMSSGDIKTEFSLSRDGVELPLTSEPIPSYELAPEPATYTLHTVHHNGFSGFQYGKTVRTGWTFQSGQVDTDNVTDPYLCVRKFLGGSGACGWQPLILLDYGLYLGLDDTARAGKPFSFTVRPWQPDQAHPAPIADVRVSVSYDDGAHWTKALVRKESGDTFRVRITHPRLDRTTGAVSIRTEVSNTAGNTVTQQIDRAYGLTDAHGGTGGHRLDIEP